MRNFDVLVVGSGIAGLSFSLKVAAAGYRVAIITKKDRAESNTNYAQGGIAAVTSQTDDVELHIADTLAAGDGLCDSHVVREVLQEGPERIQELIEIGLQFTQYEGGFSLGKEGGHSKRRILHVQDITGRAIETALLKAVAQSPLIEVFEHYQAIDLVTARRTGVATEQEPDRVLGLYVFDVQESKVKAFSAPVILLATGGVGQVYQYTTNPEIATGDGIAMAYRAGVPVANMEFVQFHPTSLFSRGAERFLISEAVRGEGAVLRNHNKETFMRAYHPLADLAPRDVVARAIDAEMKLSGAEHVWLDITHHPDEVLKERFPNIYERCAQHGIHIANDWIPVVPAAHYLCGGIVTDLNGATSLSGLYACGEAACTGLHGANRLASNSLLEALVMSHRASLHIDTYLKQKLTPIRYFPEWVDGNVQDSDERVVLSHNWRELRRTMWDYVGIVRSTKRLERAKTRITLLKKEIQDYYWNFSLEVPLLELRNLVQIAELIVECALQRKESRGLHYTKDYPEKSELLYDTRVQRE
jgi:L-aspartate oxidase